VELERMNERTKLLPRDLLHNHSRRLAHVASPDGINIREGRVVHHPPSLAFKIDECWFRSIVLLVSRALIKRVNQ
jgi:hypothetical protein